MFFSVIFHDISALFQVAHEVTVDADEEEHIYAEIGGGVTPLEGRLERLRLMDSPPVEGEGEGEGGGSTGSTSFDSSDGAPTGGAGLDGGEEDGGDAMTYRLSVLSHPSRISFA